MLFDREQARGQAGFQTVYAGAQDAEHCVVVVPETEKPSGFVARAGHKTAWNRSFSGRGGRVSAPDQDVAVATLHDFEHGGDPGFPGGAGDDDR